MNFLMFIWGCFLGGLQFMAVVWLVLVVLILVSLTISVFTKENDDEV